MYTTSLASGGVIPPQVSIGGRLAQVLYFGASGYPGYNQVNFRVPGGVVPAPAVSVRLTYLGRSSTAAEWLSARLQDALREAGAVNIRKLSVGIEEMPGQAGWYTVEM